MDFAVEIHLLIGRGRRNPMLQEFLVQNWNIELDAVVMHHDIRLIEQGMSREKHLLPWSRLMVHDLMHHRFFAIPLCRPTDDITGLLDLIVRNVLVKESPEVPFVRGRLNVQQKYSQSSSSPKSIHSR